MKLTIALLSSILVLSACGKDNKSSNRTPPHAPEDLAESPKGQPESENDSSQLKSLEGTEVKPSATPENKSPESQQATAYVAKSDAVCTEGTLPSYSTFKAIVDELAGIYAGQFSEFQIESADHEYASEFLFWYKPSNRDVSILRVVQTDGSVDVLKIDETYEEVAKGETHLNLAARVKDQPANILCVEEAE
ncbi:hypothetical protein [Pseudobacteriovorax antillogorgiicola]|uniref:Lipoprotein n=1 Tax=Pseudobacteriovorax antillogorgiicola TaxID=1513793 RepID=A0A1Y6CEX6_9BACT|nr:hypothetical protein [Pseudobacteriovorax antillogorgiicola]TCS47910.1 hypothetical protein EDD56_11921 [Pseudobacteriovorax antillogorgiicola]SMF57842.1 hypothetical protein SAMN06296036_11922 [Pseudobacteriovorax antillogorgiicola]